MIYLRTNCLVMMKCEFNVLSLDTASIGDSFKRHKVLNYPKKNCSSEAITVRRKEEILNNQWDVEKILCSLHMTLEIAVVHLSLS